MTEGCLCRHLVTCPSVPSRVTHHPRRMLSAAGSHQRECGIPRDEIARRRRAAIGERGGQRLRGACQGQDGRAARQARRRRLSGQLPAAGQGTSPTNNAARALEARRHGGASTARSPPVSLSLSPVYVLLLMSVAGALAQPGHVSLLLWYGLNPQAREDPVFYPLWREFCDSPDDAYRSSRLKLMVIIPDGPFLLRRAVPGNKPVILGKGIHIDWYRGEGYLEGNINISSSSAATKMWGLVHTVAKVRRPRAHAHGGTRPAAASHRVLDRCDACPFCPIAQRSSSPACAYGSRLWSI